MSTIDEVRISNPNTGDVNTYEIDMKYVKKGKGDYSLVENGIIDTHPTIHIQGNPAYLYKNNAEGAFSHAEGIGYGFNLAPADPSNEGWYEGTFSMEIFQDIFVKSKDTIANINKSYYTAPTAGTPSSNPKTEGFLEKVDDYYIYTSDTSKVSGKTYYKATAVTINEGNAIHINSTDVESLTAHSEGLGTFSRGWGTHAEGFGAIAMMLGSHAEGAQTTATYFGGHAEGEETIATGGIGNHAEGVGSEAIGENALHAEGMRTTSNGGNGSHSEGRETLCSGNNGSHSEGFGTTASGIDGSHAEGYQSRATEQTSHAEGYKTTASNKFAHVENRENLASGEGAHAEGYCTTASGNYSHAQGDHTIAQGYRQTVLGRYNYAQGSPTSAVNTDNALIIGNGTSSGRSNALTVKWNGNIVFADGTELTVANIAALKALVSS